MAPSPMGQLTASQLELMEAVWDGPPDGLTIAEIRKGLPPRRMLARTTVLTQVKRLWERGWLLKSRRGTPERFRPVVSRETASQRMAAAFADQFFGGSASGLVTSLLGAKGVAPKDIRRLKKLIENAETQ